MNAADPLIWFRRLAALGALLALVVVVMGAWVRLTAAGLGCPDWPGCYGHVHPAAAVAQTEAINAEHPTRHFDYGKALREMEHRYAAGTVGLIVVTLFAVSVVQRRRRDQPRVLPAVLLVVVCLQGLLGALTVTKLLTPPIVTLHLVGGLTTLSLLSWLALAPETRAVREPERRLRRIATGGLAVLILQILLGGWTSTNYAATACPDFPTCQGRLAPRADFPAAFTLWRGTGPDYEGGVLSAEARVAIHWTHRLGALIAGLTLLGVGTLAIARGPSGRVRFGGGLVVAAVCLQWLIGMNLIWQGFPLWLGTAHNAGAALLLLSTIALLRWLSPRPALARL